MLIWHFASDRNLLGKTFDVEVNRCHTGFLIKYKFMNNVILGVDIGGTHITSALIDLTEKKEIKETFYRSRVDANGTVNEIIDAWAMNIEKSVSGTQLIAKRISIAMPGPMDYRQGICHIRNQGKYDALYNVDIKEELSNRLGVPREMIKFKNDAACFLKGEIFGGCLMDVEQAIGLTLGTGLGTSHTKGGEAFDSDLWKMPFNKGIAEDYISTRWFIKRFFELSEIEIKDVKDLVDNYRESPYFRSLFLEFSLNLSKFMHLFIRKKMPLAAVIGGNIAKAEEFFLDDTRNLLAKRMGYSFPIKCSLLGENAVLLGAGSSF